LSSRTTGIGRGEGRRAFGLLLSLTLAAVACRDTAELKPFPEAEAPAPLTDDIMPNVQGFIFNIQNDFNIQGSWYWYDNGRTDITDITVTDAESGEQYAWLGEGHPRPLYSTETENTLVDEICAAGQLSRDDAPYVALGFEICSPQAGESSPYEFPYTLGACEHRGDPKETYRTFLGISFRITGSFTKLEVQFKEWGVEDDEQPYCAVHGPGQIVNADDPESLCGAERDGDAWQITARVHDALGSPGDAEEREPNLSMLQAIHIQVYGPADSAVSFCLSQIKAFGAEGHGMPTGALIEQPYQCEDVGPGEVVEDFDAGWVSPIPGDAGASEFEIMAEETSVGQYADCIAADECGNVINEWETCNVYVYRSTMHDLRDKAANCVNWCQAGDFCRWIGGRLPSEAEWMLAARSGIDDNRPYPWTGGVVDCEHAVMNDESGVGCGNDRMPEAGCLKAKGTNAAGLCDMAGNLWEWVDDYYNENPVGDHSWQQGYRKIKGGSLNSKAEALKIDAVSLEHPRIPHSPTRLGFRCVRDL
jgi:hypothetical protein